MPMQKNQFGAAIKDTEGKFVNSDVYVQTTILKSTALKDVIMSTNCGSTVGALAKPM